MKRIFIACFIALAAVANAAPFDVKQASFEQLLTQWLRPGDSPEHAAFKQACYDELYSRGPVTLSNLMDRIHIENVMVGVFATDMTKDKPIPRDQALSALLPFLQATNPVTRKMAAFFLSFYNAPEHAAELHQLLNHEKTRGAAIRTLGKWHVTNSLPNITPYLHDGKERVRVLTANALRDIADPRSIPDLIPALADPMYTVRNSAVLALLPFGTVARDPVIAALKTRPDPAARRQLIRILGDLKDATALDALKPQLADPDPEIQRDAQRAIDLIEKNRDDAFFAPGGG